MIRIRKIPVLIETTGYSAMAQYMFVLCTIPKMRVFSPYVLCYSLSSPVPMIAVPAGYFSFFYSIFIHCDLIKSKSSECCSIDSCCLLFIKNAPKSYLNIDSIALKRLPKIICVSVRVFRVNLQQLKWIHKFMTTPREYIDSTTFSQREFWCIAFKWVFM